MNEWRWVLQNENVPDEIKGLTNEQLRVLRKTLRQADYKDADVRSIVNAVKACPVHNRELALECAQRFSRLKLKASLMVSDIGFIYGR